MIRQWISTCLIGGLLAVYPAFAQQHAEQPPAPAIATQEPLPPVDPTSSKQPPAERAPETNESGSSVGEPVVSKEMLDAHVTQLRSLQAAAKKELGLSKQQEETIDALFAAHIRMLTESGGRRPFGVNPEDMKAVEELRKKLQAARESGDQEEVRKLSAQFREMIHTRRSATGVTTDQFIAKVIAVLDADQTTAFRKLIKKKRFGDARGALSDGLTPFWRAVLNPQVNLTDEQRRGIFELRAKAARLSDEARSARRDDDVPRIGAEIRAEAMSKLTPEQQARVEEILNSPPKRLREARPQNPEGSNQPEGKTP